MKKERFRLLEDLSVSPIVDKMGQDIAKQLIFKAKASKKYIADDKLYVINKGILNFDCKDYLKNIDYLKVIYIIYYLESEEEYKICDKHNMFACSADYNGKNIKLNLAFVDEEPSIQFLPSIKHELNHIFQYDNGAKKNESFYDTVVDKYRNGEKWERIIAWALYLSFKTEQDSFLAQFYEYLKSSGASKYKMETDSNNPYYQFDKAFEAVEYLDVSSEQIKESFGITENQLYSILSSADERLFKKMLHVWTKYVNEHKITKPNATEMNFLLECYKNGICQRESDMTF